MRPSAMAKGQYSCEKPLDAVLWGCFCILEGCPARHGAPWTERALWPVRDRPPRGAEEGRVSWMSGGVGVFGAHPRH